MTCDAAVKTLQCADPRRFLVPVEDFKSGKSGLAMRGSLKLRAINAAFLAIAGASTCPTSQDDLKARVGLYIMTSYSLLSRVQVQLETWLHKWGGSLHLVAEQFDASSSASGLRCTPVGEPVPSPAAATRTVNTSWLDESVLLGTFRCDAILGVAAKFMLLSTVCQSAHWGTYGPCCKLEAAVAHYHSRLMQGESLRWFVLCEDDHYISLHSLLSALSLFNSSLAMSLGPHSAAWPSLPLQRMTQNVQKIKGFLLHPTRERCYPRAIAYNFVPFHNPLILSNGAVNELGPAMLGGSAMRRQCLATGMTQDNVFGVLLWLLRIAVVQFATNCALVPYNVVKHCFNLSTVLPNAPAAAVDVGQPADVAGSGKGPARLRADSIAACRAELAANEQLHTSPSPNLPDAALRRSHFIIHNVKKRAEMLNVHDYFVAHAATGAGSTHELQSCLHRNSPESSRLRVNVGYERTQHFVKHFGQPYNATRRMWSTFTMADCKAPPLGHNLTSEDGHTTVEALGEVLATCVTP